MFTSVSSLSFYLTVVTAPPPSFWGGSTRQGMLVKIKGIHVRAEKDDSVKVLKNGESRLKTGLKQ